MVIGNMAPFDIARWNHFVTWIQCFRSALPRQPATIDSKLLKTQGDPILDPIHSDSGLDSLVP
jgi:hypothetical protein